MGLRRVGHDRSNLPHTHPGERQSREQRQLQAGISREETGLDQPPAAGDTEENEFSQAFVKSSGEEFVLEIQENVECSPERAHLRETRKNTDETQHGTRDGWIDAVVQPLSRVRLFVTPWTAARQASLSITSSRSLLKLMSIELVMPANHLILCRPLLLLPSIFPSIRVFSNESALHIRWPKYWRWIDESHLKDLICVLKERK